MSIITGASREVIEKSAWMAIVTTGLDGPHLAGCWTHYTLSLGDAGADEFIFPAGGYKTTEANLQRDPRIQLLFAAPDMPRATGKGQGCTVSGTGQVLTSGPQFDRTKAKFPWARAALVVTVTAARTHLP